MSVSSHDPMCIIGDPKDGKRCPGFKYCGDYTTVEALSNLLLKASCAHANEVPSIEYLCNETRN